MGVKRQRIDSILELNSRKPEKQITAMNQTLDLVLTGVIPSISEQAENSAAVLDELLTTILPTLLENKGENP